MRMVVRAREGDAERLARLAVLMWEDNGVQALKDEFLALMRRDDAQLFLKFVGEEAVGFAQCQLRHDYVEGASTSPVGYLEGVFVKAEHRRRGYARELLRECERWAREMGCKEFASDCEWDNEDSYRFHQTMGFEEANRIICFAKRL